VNKLSRLFIPQKSNNYHALILQPSFLSLFIVLYLLNQSVLKSLTLLKPGVLGYSSEITVEKVLDQTNRERQIQALPPLRFNSTLAQSARLKAEDMFATNYWAHTSPAGVSPWKFIRDSGYKYSIAGENLAKDFYDTESLMKAWMNSPTHRDNIIHAKYEEVGIAVVDGVLGGIKTTLVVQHFGTPLVASTASTPEEKKLNSSFRPEAQVLAETSPLPVSEPLNPILIRKIVGGLIFGIIITTLFVDAYITLKNKTKRMTGSAIGHISFLALILVLILFARQGTIF